MVHHPSTGATLMHQGGRPCWEDPRALAMTDVAAIVTEIHAMAWLMQLDRRKLKSFPLPGASDVDMRSSMLGIMINPFCCSGMG